MPQATEIFPSVFTLGEWYNQEGGYSRPLEFESTHSGKNRGTHFTCMWLG